MVFFPSRLFGFGPRQVFLILVACGVCASASDTISVCFFGFSVCFLASFFFAQEFLSISAVRFLCSAHLQFVCCLHWRAGSRQKKVDARSHFDASCQRACLLCFTLAPYQDRPQCRPLPLPLRIIVLVRSGKWNWVHVFETQTNC